MTASPSTAGALGIVADQLGTWLARDSTSYGKMPSVPSGWRPAELPNDGSVPLVAKGSLGAERAPVLPAAGRCAR